MKKYVLSSAIAMVITLGTTLTVSAQTTTDKSKQQATIVVNNQLFSKGVPVFVKHNTVWMPIDRVIRAIRAMNADVTYDGKTLLINNLALQTETLKAERPGAIDIADGGYVEDHVPVEIVKSGTLDVTYVPVWYVMHTMTQGSSGTYASWKNGQLTLADHALGVPSIDEIDRVMASATESSAKGPTGEHFVLTGKPVSITAPNGDTVTAAVGTRSPSADGYGQVIFFFHNRQFVGLDSNDEKTSIRSVKPTDDGGMSFNVTYANYASSDPLYSPSLPPVTVPFAWDGTRFSPSGKASIPIGATNGLRVHANATLSSANTSDASIPKAAQQAIKNALPKGATLIRRPGAESPYLAVDLDGNGQYDYAVAYSVGSTRQIGVMVVGQKNGNWKELLTQTTDGTELRELNAGAMTGDGTESMVIQSYVGDGANDVTVLKSLNGTIKPVLHVAGTADIGDFNEDGSMEVANWIHDTGPLESIQLYAWNPSKQAYDKANNDDFPDYFRGAPYNYNRAMEDQGASSTPQSMLDYAWATTYLHMGDYGKAASIASTGMKFPSDDYPGQQVWSSLEKTASTGQAEQEAYFHLSVQLKRAVDGVIKKYSNFSNAVPQAIPLVSQGADGIAHVRVIGTFDNTEAGRYIKATELSFAADGHGLVAGSLVAKDAFGNTVWKG